MRRAAPVTSAPPRRVIPLVEPAEFVAVQDAHHGQEDQDHHDGGGGHGAPLAGPHWLSGQQGPTQALQPNSNRHWPDSFGPPMITNPDRMLTGPPHWQLRASASQSASLQRGM